MIEFNASSSSSSLSFVTSYWLSSTLHLVHLLFLFLSSSFSLLFRKLFSWAEKDGIITKLQLSQRRLNLSNLEVLNNITFYSFGNSPKNIHNKEEKERRPQITTYCLSKLWFYPMSLPLMRIKYLTVQIQLQIQTFLFEHLIKKVPIHMVINLLRVDLLKITPSL